MGAAGPSGAPTRPVATQDLAHRLVDQVARGPSRQVDEYGGPEVLDFAGLAHAWLAARGRRRPVRELHVPGRLGRRLRAGAALPSEASDRGDTTWRQWVASAR